jgi:hypothetical protein
MANIVSTLFLSLDAASPMTASPAPGPTVNPQVRTTPHSLEYRAVAAGAATGLSLTVVGLASGARAQLTTTVGVVMTTLSMTGNAIKEWQTNTEAMAAPFKAWAERGTSVSGSPRRGTRAPWPPYRGRCSRPAGDAARARGTQRSREVRRCG